MRPGLLLFVVAVAHAQPEADAKTEAARLSELGAQTLKRDPAAALASFESAYRLYPSPKLLYNRGLALDRLGRSVEAAGAFERFVRDSADAPPAQRRYAARRLAELELLCTSLQLDVEPAAARVTLDDRPVEAGAIRILAGPHVLAAEHGGFAPMRRDFEARPAERMAVSLRLEPMPSPQPLVVVKPVAPVVQAQAHVAPDIKVGPRRTKLVQKWWLWTLVGGVLTVGAVTAAVVVTSQPSLTGSLGTVTPRF